PDANPPITELVALGDDRAFEVRFQLALSAGELKSSAHGAGLVHVVVFKDTEDPWMRTAALSSCPGYGAEVLLDFAFEANEQRDNPKPGYLQLLTQLAALATSAPPEYAVIYVVEQIHR